MFVSGQLKGLYLVYKKMNTSSAQSLASEGSISGEITMNFRAVNVLFRVQISQNHSCWGISEQCKFCLLHLDELREAISERKHDGCELSSTVWWLRCQNIGSSVRKAHFPRCLSDLPTFFRAYQVSQCARKDDKQQQKSTEKVLTDHVSYRRYNEGRYFFETIKRG